MSSPRHPPRLRAGDRVAVVSPGGPVRSQTGLEAGLARLRGWGLDPVLMPHARRVSGVLAGDDAGRADDLNRAFADRTVRAVFATRGGYGCTRILDRLDFAPLRDDPKPIVGFSDLTALLAGAWRDVGLVGLHGPMVAHGPGLAMGAECEALQQRLLTDAAAPAPLPPDAGSRPRGLRNGRAEGRLVGGNLSLVVALIGTPWEIDPRGAILFLEDVGEAPYGIDRMLTQLRQSGALHAAAGIALGDFHLERTPLGSEASAVVDVLRDRLADLPMPVALGFPFGHRPRSWTLPYGGLGRLEADERSARLALLEPACR